jgi:NhaB family Na+:H+ antiporter
MHVNQSLPQALMENFLGNCPTWYKQIIIAFLLLNPLLLWLTGPVITGWILIFEFIFTLALALKCYPLQPGGLLALEAILIGLADPQGVYREVSSNLPVILLLMFMVAGIYFMKDMLFTMFTRILLGVKSKLLLSALFSVTAAVLSAFLDALTVTAVLISVSVGFYTVYHRAASGIAPHLDHDRGNDDSIQTEHKDDLEQFRAFLRNLMMHGAVGTALGGVTTLVGEPQNLLIAEKAGWNFSEFFLLMAPITIPVFITGVITCLLVEQFKWFSYGALLPDTVRKILQDFAKQEEAKHSRRDKVALVVQILVALMLMLALAFHLAEVGLIGLMVIILLTAFNGITEEHQIGKAFAEALPFTALLVVFFAVVTVIHQQHLFNPIINWVLTLDIDLQPQVFFAANGILSAISDNVFVATIYINEAVEALNAGIIDQAHFDKLAIAINTGTNIPSVATPNGQAAFLFLLTSALAPLIRLSYGTMVFMALPYTITMSLVGYIAVGVML